MMKKLLLSLFILFPVLIVWAAPGFLNPAHAEGVSVGPDCTFSWVRDPATAATVTKSTVYTGTTANALNTAADVGNVTTATCSALGLTLSGQYYAAITDSNIAGESVKSNIVPFVLVTTPPGAPTATIQ